MQNETEPLYGANPFPGLQPQISNSHDNSTYQQNIKQSLTSDSIIKSELTGDLSYIGMGGSSTQEDILEREIQQIDRKHPRPLSNVPLGIPPSSRTSARIRENFE